MFRGLLRSEEDYDAMPRDYEEKNILGPRGKGEKRDDTNCFWVVAFLIFLYC